MRGSQAAVGCGGSSSGGHGAQKPEPATAVPRRVRREDVRHRRWDRHNRCSPSGRLVEVGGRSVFSVSPCGAGQLSGGPAAGSSVRACTGAGIFTPSRPQKYASGDRDLFALIEVIEEGRCDDPGEAMPWAVFDGLLRLVPSQGLLFNEISLREQQPAIMQASMEGGARGVGFGPEDEPPYPDYWLHRQHFRPSRHFDYSHDFVSVLRVSDFYTLTELKNTPFFAEYIRPTGMI